MKKQTKVQLISLLCISAYSAYQSIIIGSDIKVVLKRFEFFHNFKVGNLVMEISTIWNREKDPDRIGILQSDRIEALMTEKDWKIQEVEETLDGFSTERPTGRVFRIKRLLDGSEQLWHNASMIRVPLEMKDFPG
jgi:hypothetical protein